MRRKIGVAAILVLATAACGGSGGGGPAAPSAPLAASTPAPSATPAATTAPVSDLTGTWRGGGAVFTLVWELQQQGSTVTGVSQYVDGHGVMSEKGRVTATLSGNQLTFRDEYRPGPSGCNEDVTGTLTVEGSRMSGLFAAATDCGPVERGDVVLRR